MGALKDIADLCIKLRDEAGDRKAAEAIDKIQPLILALQSEQTAIVEKNTELMRKNFDLERKLLDLEKSHAQEMAAIKKKHLAEMAKITTSHAKPKEDLAKEAKNILAYAFQKADEFSNQEIAGQFGMELSVAKYYFETLRSKGLLDYCHVQHGDNPLGLEITEQGRKYVMENRLLA